ncbi:hypothetical protein HYS94_04195 [Candidatus Daviesbacteria bacterium]|nr:hypothetical protein [Candidatus Daviesbacteria bacterium]
MNERLVDRRTSTNGIRVSFVKDMHGHVRRFIEIGTKHASVGQSYEVREKVTFDDIFNSFPKKGPQDRIK